MSDPPKPLPRVSAKHYQPAAPAPAAKVRFREKGSPHEGDLYQGQKLVIPCKGCGAPPQSLLANPP